MQSANASAAASGELELAPAALAPVAAFAEAVLEVPDDRCATPGLEEHPPQPATSSAAPASTTALMLILRGAITEIMRKQPENRLRVGEGFPQRTPDACGASSFEEAISAAVICSGGSSSVRRAPPPGSLAACTDPP